MRLLIRLIRERRREIGIILALSVIEAVPIAALGGFLARALDHGFLRGRAGVGLLWLSAVLGAIVLGAAARRMIQHRLSTVVNAVVDELIRIVVAAALGSSGRARDIASIEPARRHISALLRMFRQAGIAIVATVIGIAVLSPILVLYVAPALVVALIAYGFLLPRLVVCDRAVVRAEDAVTSGVTGLLRGLRDVLACQVTDRAAADMAVAVDRHAAESRRLAAISALRVAIVALGAQLPLLLLLGFGSSLIHSGRLSIGELVAAAGYLLIVLQPALRSLVHPAGDEAARVAVAMSRIAEDTAAPAADPVPGTATPAGYALSVSNVTFAYGRTADPVFRDFDLTLAEGEHLAVVGATGSGKSTLADLMCGLIRPQRGEIRLAGVPLESWDPTALHARMALAVRDPYVFAGTVADNVGYSNSGADLIAAADAVDLWPLLDRLGGWDAVVRPAALTAPARQLIGLARAYASPARLVILDEAGCHLESAREEFVEQSFRDRAGSLIVMPHRIDSARRADRILVLDAGAPISGRHEELVRTSPVYAKLVGHREPVVATEQSAL